MNLALTIVNLIAYIAYVYVGDSCIQNSHLGRYIVGYTFGKHVLRLRTTRFTAPLARRRETKFPTVYPTIYLPKWKFWILLSHSNAFLQFRLKYIAGLTVANFWHYPIRRRVTKARALVCMFNKIHHNYQANSSKHITKPSLNIWGILK